MRWMNRLMPVPCTLHCLTRGVQSTFTTTSPNTHPDIRYKVMIQSTASKIIFYILTHFLNCVQWFSDIIRTELLTEIGNLHLHGHTFCKNQQRFNSNIHNMRWRTYNLTSKSTFPFKSSCYCWYWFHHFDNFWVISICWSITRSLMVKSALPFQNVFTGSMCVRFLFRSCILSRPGFYDLQWAVHNPL